jgi:hypothetical protein
MSVDGDAPATIANLSHSTVSFIKPGRHSVGQLTVVFGGTDTRGVAMKSFAAPIAFVALAAKITAPRRTATQ